MGSAVHPRPRQHAVGQGLAGLLAVALGLYPAGESRTVTFRHAGVVRTYCSIHESMSGTIFVAPTRYFAVLRPAGDFEIRDVAPGRYKLTTWCERLPAISREIEVQAGKDTAVELVIGSVKKP